MTNELENGKENFVGKIKETAGKITEDEDLELKGKLQSMKADMWNRVDDMREDVLETANDIIDRMKDLKKDNDE